MRDKHYKSIEKILKNYNMLKLNIEIADKQLQRLEEDDGLKGVSYDKEQLSKTYKFISATEDTAIEKIIKKDKIEKDKDKSQEWISIMDRLINELDDVEKEILKMYYMEGMQWWQIAHKVKYSERWCKELRTKAIRKLVVGLYGKEAL